MKNPFAPPPPEVLEPQYLVFRDRFLIAQLEHRGRGFMVSVDLGCSVSREDGAFGRVFPAARKQAQAALVEMLNRTIDSRRLN